jgi:hypothetical protein
MKENWLINNIFKNMTHGFYIDFGSPNNQESPTFILDHKYKWRGIYQTKEKLNSRSKFCHIIDTNINENPNIFIDSVNSIHPGSMLHYVYINECQQLSNVFDSFYNKNITTPYLNNPHYLRLNIIFLELSNCYIDQSFIDTLKDKHDLILFNESHNNYKFINQVYNILL